MDGFGTTRPARERLNQESGGQVMPFQLVPTPAPPDMSRFVDDLASSVASGDVTGLGVVVMMKGRRVFVDVFGQMMRFPIESRGFVAELDDCLREISHKRRDTNTTI